MHWCIVCLFTPHWHLLSWVTLCLWCLHNRHSCFYTLIFVPQALLDFDSLDHMLIIIMSLTNTVSCQKAQTPPLYYAIYYHPTCSNCCFFAVLIFGKGHLWRSCYECALLYCMLWHFTISAPSHVVDVSLATIQQCAVCTYALLADVPVAVPVPGSSSTSTSVQHNSRIGIIRIRPRVLVHTVLICIIRN